MPPKASGKRYAQAIFQLALEQDQLDQWDGDLEFAAGVLQDDGFKALLSHADVAVADKLKAVDAVMEQIHPTVRNMVSLLVTKSMVGVVQAVRTSYSELLDSHRGRQRVQVTSAVPLEPPELDRITRFVANLVRQEVVVSTEVDESILGGIVIQVGDRLLDGSTRSRLDSLRNRMHSEIIAPGA